MKQRIILIAVAAIIGLGVGYVLFGTSHADTMEATEHDHETGSENQMWTCSMHPQIMQPEPGDCPICGMDLVEKENNNDAKSASLLPISKERQQQFNLKTEQVEKGTFWQYFKTFGTITENKSNVYKPTLFSMDGLKR